MPRKGRIDFPGALHHVVIRGINRAPIFYDDLDRKNFLKRLEKGINQTSIACFAWALIPNHAHLLLRTGAQPLTSLMRSLLTGYAVFFNHRHQRSGYLFQNRYKSILCDEEPYLLQLVRYIHLNPLRAGLVSNLQELNIFPWCGHSAVISTKRVKWQDVKTILAHFGSRAGEAKNSYMQFIEDGISEGQRPDLTKGYLLRGTRGWSKIAKDKKGSEYWRGDERILGDPDFVERALKIAKERLEKKEKSRTIGWDLDKLLQYVAKLLEIPPSNIKGKKRDRKNSQARALFSWWATDELGYTLTEVSDFLLVSAAAIHKAMRRGQKFSGDKELEFPG